VVADEPTTPGPSLTKDESHPASLLPLLLPQVTLNQLCVCRLERGNGLPQHLHEIVNFFGRRGMANVDATAFAWNGPIGIDDQFTALIKESEEGQAVTLGAQLRCQRWSARRLEAGFRAPLLNVEPGDHEMLGEDRLDCGGLDKPIEVFAPPSPGGFENHEDVPVLPSSLRLGIGQHLLRGG